MEEIMLSVYVATYGQEEYIGRALDSVLMQKTHYSFEILVGEDASPDHTREILRKYEQRYPGKFQMLYQDINTYGTPNNIFVQLRRKCRGKYIIGLEGDDYWTDELKLEKQISFLEEHPDYLGVAHRCIVVDSDSNPINEQYPECTDKEYTLSHFFSEILPGQFTTVMHVNPIYHPEIDWSLWGSGLAPGDRLLYYTLVLNGKVYCIQQTMSAYRHVINGGTSYSAHCRYNFEEYNVWTNAIVQYTYRHGSKRQIEYAEVYYLISLMMGRKMHAINWHQVLQLMHHTAGYFRIFRDMLMKKIRIRLLHRKIYVKVTEK